MRSKLATLIETTGSKGAVPLALAVVIAAALLLSASRGGIIATVLGLFVLIIITFCSGELVWRERDARTDQLIDALPIPTWMPFISKLLALMLVGSIRYLERHLLSWRG